MGFHVSTALFLPNADSLVDAVTLYRKALKDNGYDPPTREVMAITQMYCAEDHEEAFAGGRVFAENYYRFSLVWRATQSPAIPCTTSIQKPMQSP